MSRCQAILMVALMMLFSLFIVTAAHAEPVRSAPAGLSLAAPLLAQADAEAPAEGEEGSAVGGFVKDMGIVLIIFAILAQIAARMWIWGMMAEENPLWMYISRIPVIGDIWVLIVLHERWRDLSFPLVMSVASVLLFVAGMSLQG